MSVLIKTMEMPKNCGECQLCHTENFNLWCCLTGREDIFYDAMPEWCPLEKPKTGEWIEMIDCDPITGEPYPCGVQCSDCGETLGCVANFCPNCGSDNRGRSE